MEWKKLKKFFHTVEKTVENFPYCGKTRKIFSILWKKRRKIFHGVEKSEKYFPWSGKRGGSWTAGGGGLGVDGEAEVGEGGFAEAGLKAGEDFGGGGAAEFHEPHGVGDVDKQDLVVELGGAGVGGELGADDVRPGGGDLRDMGVGGELHALEDAGNKVADGGGAGVGGGRGVVGEVETFAGDGPLAFVVAGTAVHRGAS